MLHVISKLEKYAHVRLIRSSRFSAIFYWSVVLGQRTDRVILIWVRLKRMANVHGKKRLAISGLKPGSPTLESSSLHTSTEGTC